MSEKVLLRVEKGMLVPHDHESTEQLRERGYKVGDILSAELRKPRNPQFHRLAHAFGRLCAANIEDFEGLSAHEALKRCQIEGNIACEEIRLTLPDVGPCEYRVPKSLSFASMDEGEFTEVFIGMCRYVSKAYWPDCNEDQIAEMASAMVDQ